MINALKGGKKVDYVHQIVDYTPWNIQESQDKKVILSYIDVFSHNVLLRENEIAHITSSGFIMNEELNRVLMIHHNIRNKWSWTGGHADGEEDLLNVAIKEAKEETGLKSVIPISEKIASIDILPVYGHVKRDKYVNAHLHLSIAYILIANESDILVIKEDENSGVKWMTTDTVNEDNFIPRDVYLYNKLIQKARGHRKKA